MFCNRIQIKISGFPNILLQLTDLAPKFIFSRQYPLLGTSQRRTCSKQQNRESESLKALHGNATFINLV